MVKIYQTAGPPAPSIYERHGHVFCVIKVGPAKNGVGFLLVPSTTFDPHPKSIQPEKPGQIWLEPNQALMVGGVWCRFSGVGGWRAGFRKWGSRDQPLAEIPFLMEMVPWVFSPKTKKVPSFLRTPEVSMTFEK